ncbi:hypothetical protein K3495_g11881 [Podosphaera aphanis]|nr:hypothetical protein K3495_g11881 [Podosphaera aphanis]
MSLRPKLEDKLPSRETYEDFNKLGKQEIGFSDNPKSLYNNPPIPYSLDQIYRAPNPNTIPLYADSQIENSMNQLELEYNHVFSRELSDLQKCYWSDAQKYSGTVEESFYFKFLVFINNCKRSGITPSIVPQAFPIILHGSALDYFYHNCDGNTLTVKELHRQFIQRYENEEHRRNMERKWNSISLRIMILENQNLPMETVFRNLVDRLQQLQRVLDVALRSEAVLRQK